MEYLLRRGRYEDEAEHPMPDLILLDLNMPKKDGRTALKEIKAEPGLRRLPVVVLTTSDAERDIVATYDLGANSYIIKPDSFDAFRNVMQQVNGYWFAVVRLPPVAYASRPQDATSPA